MEHVKQGIITKHPEAIQLGGQKMDDRCQIHKDLRRSHGARGRQWSQSSAFQANHRDPQVQSCCITAERLREQKPGCKSVALSSDLGVLNLGTD